MILNLSSYSGLGCIQFWSGCELSTRLLVWLLTTISCSSLSFSSPDFRIDLNRLYLELRDTLTWPPEVWVWTWIVLVVIFGEDVDRQKLVMRLELWAGTWNFSCFLFFLMANLHSAFLRHFSKSSMKGLSDLTLAESSSVVWLTFWFEFEIDSELLRGDSILMLIALYSLLRNDTLFYERPGLECESIELLLSTSILTCFLSAAMSTDYIFLIRSLFTK